ncbi:class I SAM-dependent methyltransferase [Streptomyces sp. C10-9-1]|uniref:class I SAM-dependent methyltransferase n=1 Tax=Streptomyces sp. C10-9-1 TaxID=1859285 RepID=UPI0021131E1A|nr:class I SAM-dependent methyltransferase [Streptomyces sp. C10-9-1]MCQ6553346.1 class I SAM-dependent methyltransferase [Streptomyces sp. C10-9-1]
MTAPPAPGEPPVRRAPAPRERAPRFNADADWDAWPVDAYLRENYRELHPCDAAVIRHHAAVYRGIAPGSVASAVECGTGPNLYPLMAAAAACRRIDALEPGAGNRAYLRRQLAHGPDPAWQPFYDLCRSLDPALPPALATALSRVRVVPGALGGLPGHRYGLASMTFVAESVTTSAAEFADLCRAFARAVRPGGRLLAAFMAGMPSYRIADGPLWPALPVGEDTLRAVFAPLTASLRITRVAKDPTLPEYGDTGMLLLSATRPGPGA